MSVHRNTEILCRNPNGGFAPAKSSPDCEWKVQQKAIHKEDFSISTEGGYRLFHPSSFVGYIFTVSTLTKEGIALIKMSQSKQIHQSDGVACKSTRKPMKPRSEVWKHFTKLIDDGSKATCNYCGKEFCCDNKKNGTSGLKGHMTSCKMFPQNLDPKQQELSLQPLEDNENTGSLSNWKFNQLLIRKTIAEMIIIDELPFKFIESRGFKKLLSIACPKFKLQSRWTVSRDCVELYTSEKIKLKAFLKTNSQRVCITTDTWTSLQRVNYMCITAHFIDHEWNLHKKILNFCLISSHKGEAIGRLLIECLTEWGIKDVFTVTVDNASSNDVAVSYLKKKILSWGTGISNYNFLHMRCIAHIINLIVQDGLKDVNSSIVWTRKAIRYIRASSSRLQKFKECAQQCNILCKASLCFDVPTRWNFTFKMLDIAEKYERAFDLYEIQESGFRHEVESDHENRNVEVDNDNNIVFIDWSAVRKVRNMLQYFYDATIRISGSSYITANTFWTEISDLLGVILQWSKSDDLEVKSMGIRMKLKFDKYWGDHTKINKLIFIATIFDPREKFEIMKFAFCKLYGKDDGEKLFEGVEEALFNLFDEYSKLIQPEKENASQSSADIVNQGASTSLLTKRKYRGVFKEEYLRQKLATEGAKQTSELNTYLSEALVEDREDFDILRWWRLNSERFPILSCMSRDILAVPISTVAPEAAFSTGGRVLDAFRSSLTPKMAESLICAEDWLRDGINVDIEEEMDDVENFEKDLQSVGSNENVQSWSSQNHTDYLYCRTLPED